MPTMGAKWKQISPRWPELGSDPRTPHDRSPGRRCRPGSQPPLQQPSGRMSCKVMNPKTRTHLRSKEANRIQKSGASATESAEHEQSVRRNMSQYVTTCHDMSRCHQRSTGLFSDEWAVLQKEVNGVEDVPCKRTDDARGSWVLQEILIRGISWILYYYHPKNISGLFHPKNISEHDRKI